MCGQSGHVRCAHAAAGPYLRVTAIFAGVTSHAGVVRHIHTGPCRALLTSDTANTGRCARGDGGRAQTEDRGWRQDSRALGNGAPNPHPRAWLFVPVQASGACMAHGSTVSSCR